MSFIISMAISLILILFAGIKIALLGPTLLSIKVEYAKYRNLSPYANVIYFILGLILIILSHIIARAITIPYEIVSSMFLWGGLVYLYSSLRMMTTMYIKEKGIYHGVNIIKWEDIKEWKLSNEYFIVEQRNGHIFRFEIEQSKKEDFIKILSKKLS